MSDDLKKFVGEKVGEATACWENLSGAGVFQAERASKILEEIYTAINQQLYYEIDALIIGAYHSPFNSPETNYDTLAKKRKAELGELLTAKGPVDNSSVEEKE